MPSEPVREEEYFTMVFRGSLRSYRKNPFHMDTPFGWPVAIGIGNAFDEIERLENEEASDAE